MTKSVAKKTSEGAMTGSPIAHGVGRRKNAVARVWMRRGNGKMHVNGKDYTHYFDTIFSAETAITPFKVCPVSVSYDFEANVTGGGKVAQADAVKLGIARAFLEFDESMKPVLRKNGLLTVDARKKERKKYGQRGARRKFQFVKR